MYKIIGGDGNEYGPVSAETLRQWYAEGRVSGETQVCQDGGGGWLPMSAFPEFAALTTQKIAPPPEPATPPPFSAGAENAGPTPVAADDYELDIGGCITRGWNLVKTDFGVLFGGSCVYFAIFAVLGALGNIPFVGVIFSVASMFIGGPLLGGLYFLFLKALRGDSAEVGDVFAGFRRGFFQLFLGQLVPALFVLSCLIPAVVVIAVTVFPALLHHQSVSLVQWLLVGSVTLLCMIPACYLQVSWLFTLPLIVDKEMDFGTAMKTSWRRVNHHWWHVFGLAVVAALVASAGLLACCVGILVTLPIQFAALMFAYETIFSGRKD